MSIPSFSEWPDIPQRSAPEADFDAKMYALFQHFANTHRDEMLAFISFLENNSTVIGGALNATTIGLTTPAAGKFTSLEAADLGSSGLFGLGGTGAVTEIADVDALGTPVGFWTFTSATPNSASLPAELSGQAGVIWVTRASNSVLTQIAWRNNGDGGIFRRAYSGGAWKEWDKQYAQQNVLGAASQAGGVPTGALIEHGSNANGEYVRLADGTQICTLNLTGSVDVTNAEGALYSSASYTWAYPAAFAAGGSPVVAGIGNQALTWATANNIGLTSSNIRMVSTTSGTGRDLRVMAVGRWF